MRTSILREYTEGKGYSCGQRALSGVLLGIGKPGTALVEGPTHRALSSVYR